MPHIPDSAASFQLSDSSTPLTPPSDGSDIRQMIQEMSSRLALQTQQLALQTQQLEIHTKDMTQMRQREILSQQKISKLQKDLDNMQDRVTYLDQSVGILNEMFPEMVSPSPLLSFMVC